MTILYGVFRVDAQDGIERVVRTGRSSTPAVYSTLGSARAQCTRSNRYTKHHPTHVIRELTIGEEVK